MQGHHSAPLQAVTPQAVPAANHQRRYAEILGDGLHGISAMHFVAGDAPRISSLIRKGMLSRRYRNYQLGVGLECDWSIEMVSLGNGLGRSVVGAGQRGQGIARMHGIVAPPQPHSGW